MQNFDEQARKLRKQIMGQEAVSSIAFVVMAQNEMLDEVTISEHPDVFVEWDENFTTNLRGQIVKEIVNGEPRLFKNIHPIISRAQNRRPSEDTTMQMWKPIGNPEEEYPEWSQPISGVDNPYMMGDKVTRWDRKFHSTIDNNWWDPLVRDTSTEVGYGWVEDK